MEKFPLHRATWPFIALIVSAAMLATAHAFETFLLLAPCPLCHNQRQIYWAAGTIALIAVFLNWRGAPPRLMSTMCVLLGIVFLTGAGIAGYHSLVEWRILPAPDTCSASGPLKIEGKLSDILSHPIAVPSCAEAKWRLLGLSMAGWNFLVSLALVAGSFIAAQRPLGTDTANEPVQIVEA